MSLKVNYRDAGKAPGKNDNWKAEYMLSGRNCGQDKEKRP
jgi:hypothetical protein